jgi:hypothetical protein
VLWVCVCRIEPACSAPDQGDGTVGPTRWSDTESAVLDVWIVGEDPAWTARAEGQLSDLPVRIHVLSKPVRADPEQQLAAGKAAGAAGLLAWLWPDARAGGRFSPEGAGAYLFAWSTPAQRLYVRRVGPRFADSDAAEWSASLEIAALALRTAARATLAGSSWGVRSQRLSPVAPIEKPGPLVDQAAQAGETRRLHWYSSGRVSDSLDGETDAGLASLGIELQVESGRWRMGAFAELGLPSTLDSRQAELTVRRHAAAAILGRVSEVSPAVHLIPELWAGVVGFRRETRSESAQMRARNANTSTSGLLGLGCSIEWVPFQSAFTAFGLGASWVPGAPTLRLMREDGSILASHRLWQLQPQGALQLGIDW